MDFLEGLGLEFYKIASFEMIDLPLVEYVASRGKPMLLDDLRPQGHGGDGAHGAHGMVREAHGEAEALLHVLYGGQVHLLRIRDLPLVEYVASRGKPLIMSTGMGTLEEIREAVEAVRKTGNRQLALLRCSSAYPADPKEMHLSTSAFSFSSGCHSQGMYPFP